MALCYNRLWKLLIDRGMTRTQMRLAAGISTTTLAKLSKGEDVNTSILVKICDALGCGIHDIVDSAPEVRTVIELVRQHGRRPSRHEKMVRKGTFM